MNRQLNRKYLIPFEDVLQEQLRDLEFKAIWEVGAARRKVASVIIGERIRRNLSQAQLAQKAGLKQPNIARMESGSISPTLHSLEKLAGALGKRLEVRFV